ncbi:MAG: DUF3482 domain-containing protein [Acidobacteria bacterium]|nr:DUF3482 domain-containing protein [Acidobacteriota bacterium]
MKIEITLSLISHTNVGKTTLARTLLARDVGDVSDQPHVTDESERFVFLENEDGRLVLWDTPGFGAIKKGLLQRVRHDKGAWQWLLREVVDKLVNRSLYCSVEAARNVGKHADVVIYLVDARLSPQDSPYVQDELELLDAIGKPVIIALNQTADQTKALQTWTSLMGTRSVIRDVLVLDSVRRSWHNESKLLKSLLPLLEPEKADVARQFLALREQNTLDSVKQAADMIADLLDFAADQRIDATDCSKREAVDRLSAQLLKETERFTLEMAALHHIDVEGNAVFRRQLEDVSGHFQLMDEKKTGFWSGAITGASTGLIADAMAGGLSFGGGFVLGAVLGGLGGMSLAHVLNATRKDEARWQPAVIHELLLFALQIYLVCARHGRGGGTLKLDDRLISADDIQRAAQSIGAAVRIDASDHLSKAIYESIATWINASELDSKAANP